MLTGLMIGDKRLFLACLVGFDHHVNSGPGYLIQRVIGDSVQRDGRVIDLECRLIRCGLPRDTAQKQIKPS